MTNGNERNAYASRLPSDFSRTSLIYKIAKMHFKKNKSQKHIADKLGITRWQVSKLLLEAERKQIVEINILPLLDRHADLEVNLEKKFNLEVCGVK